MAEGTPGVGEVTQDDALAAGEAVGGHQVGEGHGVLQHVAHDGFGRDLEFLDPGIGLSKRVIGLLEEFLQGLGPRDVFDDGHALGVVHAIGLELGDLLAAALLLLGDENLAGVVEDGFEDGDNVERVGVRLWVEQAQCGERERRQGLVERKIAGEFAHHVVGAAVDVEALGGLLDDAGAHEPAEEIQRREDILVLLGAGVVVGTQEVAHVLVAVAVAGKDIEQHGVGDLELAGELLRLGIDESQVGLL